jgi:hypothetical protein
MITGKIMIMRKTGLLLAFLGCISGAGAQSPTVEAGIRERMYVSTDKENYLSGEIVRMKLITTDDEGTPLTFSKVGYVELVGEDKSHARERIEIRRGVGEGTLVLPSALPTGWYRLIGYTRWMRNEGGEVFFDKRIGVINPALAGVPRGGASSDPQPARDGSFEAGRLNVSADRSVYAPRSEVKVDISGIPADMHTLGISVVAADPFGRFSGPALGAWKEDLAKDAPPFSGEYEAEYEGALITGKLISTTTGQAAFAPGITPLASFPGDEIHFFNGSVTGGGDVTFRTSRTAGFDEIVTTLLGSGDESRRIDLDDPFTQIELARPLPPFPVEAVDRESTLRQSLSMQIQYSYANDSLTRRGRPSPLFFERPDRSYQMGEWRRFATMHEVMTEFIQLARFYRRDGKWYLSVYNENFNSNRTFALVLLDGIPIINHDIIYNYNPLLIDRIDVYYDRYLFGNSVYLGIVALYTEQNTYPELQPDPFTQILSYPSPQARRLFYAPDHTIETVRASRVPDYRHTLYWDADIEADRDGQASVSFSTSDLTGRYQILVEGITASGEPLSAVRQIEVR